MVPDLKKPDEDMKEKAFKIMESLEELEEWLKK